MEVQHLVERHFVAFLLAALCCFGALIILLRGKRGRARRSAEEGPTGPLRPLTLNCWYCNTNQTVPALLKDGWTCDHCTSLNVGFNEEGDYRTVPREMYDEKLNHGIAPREVVNPGASYFSVTRGTVSPHNVLCDRCQVNQTLWLQQLSAFVPQDERNEDREMEAFKRHLDKIYALCAKCAEGVSVELDRKHRVLEEMSIARRIAESAKNSVRKLRTTRQTFRSLSSALRIYRVLVSFLLLAVFIERLYVMYHTNDDSRTAATEELRQPLLVESWLMVLFGGQAQLLADALSYAALSLWPVDLLLTVCRPRAFLLPYRHTTQLFVEFFLCLVQAVPLLDMKSERASIEWVHHVPTSCAIVALLVLELPPVETLFARIARYRQASVSRLSASSRALNEGEEEDESASFSASPRSTSRTGTPRSSVTLRQRHDASRAPLAFTAPPNPFAQLGVEDKLASISLFEEHDDNGAMMMDWTLH